LALQKEKQNIFSFDLLFEGKPKEDFKPKIQKFLERIEIPFLKDYHFTIDTENTFPHSSESPLQRQEWLLWQ
jgi:diphosphomevalonate decarboxylase